MEARVSEYVYVVLVRNTSLLLFFFFFFFFFFWLGFAVYAPLSAGYQLLHKIFK